jgi:uncharacterized membrane protein YuzA (DUF378 family)
MKIVNRIACWALVFAGLVLGIEGIIDKDIIELALGNSIYEVIVDLLLGVSAIIVAINLITKKECCK